MAFATEVEQLHAQKASASAENQRGAQGNQDALPQEEVSKQLNQEVYFQIED